MMPSARLGAMSGVPKAPAAPRLRAIREAWLRPVIGQLEADPGGWFVVPGRGDADDWSDVDPVIVVPDDQVDRYADAPRLLGPERVALSFDARHNAPRGAGSVGVHYVIDGLPFNADWYIYPDSQGAWVARREGGLRSPRPPPTERQLRRAPGQARSPAPGAQASRCAPAPADGA